ncbi:MAG: hypothetical protein IKH26_10555 [Bacteroidaceae bacterium]|nr:hypothetical protein [Bacteroidaceae bacterium]
MKERKSSTISIIREEPFSNNLSENIKTIATIPITPESKRVFRLMEDDYIELVFSLGDAVHFAVGDWCDDELFGRFVITDEQMPAYNQGTGGYDYTLKLEAPYMALRNKVHTLPSTFNDTAVRKETNWTLTDTLASHARVIVDNAILAGVDCFNAVDGGLYPIEITAEKALERKCIVYGGIDMLSALKAISDAYETEWWVKDGILHFGKCEGAGEPYVFRLGRNVERMSVQNDTQEYANSIFAYGGTSNVPSTYRRSLRFAVTETGEITSTRVPSGMTGFVDGTKKVTLGMLHGGGVRETYTLGRGSGERDLYSAELGSLELLNASECVLGGDIDFRARMVNGETSVGKGSVVLSLLASKSGDTAVVLASSSVDVDMVGSGIVRSGLHLDGSVGLSAGTYTLSVRATFGVAEGSIYMNGTKSIGSGTVSVNAEALSCGCKLVYDGSAYDVTFNPGMSDEGEAEYYMFAFDGSVPQGFGVGSAYTLLFHGSEWDGALVSMGLEVTSVPLSWFSADYDNPSSIWSVGENRLMIPVDAASDADFDIEDGRISLAGLSAGQSVERAVVFEQIHPQCVLVVTDVKKAQRQTKEEHEDGSRTSWQWTEYRLKCRTIEGADFPFKGKYVKPGETLRVRFMTEVDAGATAEEIGQSFGHTPSFLLAGMTFDASFDGSTGEFTLVRNEDYGAMLPNETLCPGLGDPFTLLNWDVRAMSSLGLVESAEGRLLEKALEYLRAMDEGQFVFTCEMMSEWMFHTEDGWADLQTQDGIGGVEDFRDSDERRVRVWHVMPIPFLAVDGTGHQPIVADGRQFLVRNGYYWFLLPLEGARVTVVHSALKMGEKTSRIIGYEFKLDKPYDTPKYTIGETEAYSRLKRIEKEMTKK